MGSPYYYKNKPQNKRKQGEAIERHVITHLESHGLKLLRRNFYSYFGEIDLIMQDENYLVFIEVRQRNNPYYANGIMSVDHRKQQKITKTAEYFLMTHPHYAKNPCRFDVIGVSTMSGIEWIKNAFW